MSPQSTNTQLRASLKMGLTVKLRQFWQKQRLGSLGRQVYIDKNVQLADAKIVIGDRTTIGYHCFIFSSANINIGNDCLIAPFVYLVDSDHGIAKSQNINVQANLTEDINIGNDVWIGTGAKILKGVNIGEGAVIASSAVVKEDVAPYSIVGGIPAKKISERV